MLQAPQTANNSAIFAQTCFGGYMPASRGCAMKNRDKDAAELAWKMFEKTGSVSYYMLYKQLSGRE